MFLPQEVLAPLRCYFVTDDGSLPEVELTCCKAAGTADAFAYLFACGARVAASGSVQLWLGAEDRGQPFMGPGDARRVLQDEVEPFHISLADIACDGVLLPELGVLVMRHGLTLDYRMGPSWGEREVQAFLLLLHQLQQRGAVMTVPWWGEEGQHRFETALAAIEMC
ncbi:TPA: hypothetical protein UMT89_003481 [Stenotrophomonas maltophilia]|nr:hypothetical protein [Stenotrophomonas maltophilia]MBH1843898.1 hypothetical protein [Stenotrophomonas maltophilia]HEL3812103.1 hypothetical protein [Stenotrophomonas maltophilia]